MSYSPRPLLALRARQRGVSIIAAIFLVLLFAALAAFMATLVSTANVTSAQDIQGSRAYQAAQAGAEWGLFQLDPDGTGAAVPACFADASPVFPAFAGFAVLVHCDRFPGAATTYAEAGKTIAVYRITSTATTGGTPPAAIERQVAINVEKCRDPAILVAPFDC